MLANTLELVGEARRHGVAVGAFNTYSLELTQAILQAAEQLAQPVILQLGVASVKTGREELVKATVIAAQRASVPAAVHLDHCTNSGMIEQCLSWGCSSALADGSHLSFAENIAFTRNAVELASSYNATIEAELGYLAGTEDGVTAQAVRASLTDPEQAREFVAATGASMLAVAIGNVHVRTAFLTAIAAWGQRVGPTPDVRQKGQDWLDLMREATAAAQIVVAEHIRTAAMM